MALLCKRGYINNFLLALSALAIFFAISYPALALSAYTNGASGWAIYVWGTNAVENLTSINKSVASYSLLEDLGNKEWLLKVPMIVNGTSTTLRITDADTNWLKLQSLNNSSVAYLKIQGKGIINNTKITSWNTTNGVVAPSEDEYRSYVFITGPNANMNITNTNISYLGYPDNMAFAKTGVFYYLINTSFTVKNNTFSYNGVGVYIHTSNKSIVQNNTVFNNSYEGFSFYRSNDILLEYNSAYYNNLSGIKIVTTNNSKIRYNYNIHHNLADDYYAGIYLHTNRNTLVEGNHDIHDNFDGIQCSFCKNVNITSNYNIYNHVLDDGILLYGSNFSFVINNYNLWNNKNGIVVDKSEIGRSTETTESLNNTINNNYNITSINIGIFIDGTDFTTVSSNIGIRNSTNYDGITLKYSYNNSVKNNVIYNNYYRGIFSYWSQDNIFENNTIINTTLKKDYNIENSKRELIRNPKTESDNTIYIITQSGSSDTILESTENMLFNFTDVFILQYYENVANVTIPDSITANITTHNAFITPSSDYLNITVISWNSTYKLWNESSPNPSVTAYHVIGDFPANAQIMIKKNGAYWNTFTSNASGYITFTYSEGYSEIQFEASAAAGNSCPSWVAGKFGKGLRFDGADDYINITSLSNSGITIGLWKKSSADAGWFHLVNSSGTFYVNGAAGGGHAVPVSNFSGRVLIGIDNTGSFFNGAIDEVRIWNRALAPDETMIMKQVI